MSSKFTHFIIPNQIDKSGELYFEYRSQQSRQLFTLGLTFFIAGLLSIVLSQFVTTAINIFLAIILLAIGILTAIYAKSVGSFSRDIWPWITALSLCICGLLLLINPKIGAISITLILAVFFIFTGLGKLTLGQMIRSDPIAKWIVASGFVDIVLSFLIFYNIQNLSTWLLGALLGISLCVQGWWNMRLARNIHKYKKRYVYSA